MEVADFQKGLYFWDMEIEEQQGRRRVIKM